MEKISQKKLELPEDFSKIFSQDFKKYHGKMILEVLRVKNAFEKKSSIIPNKERDLIARLLETGRELLGMRQQEFDYLNTKVFFELFDALKGAEHFLDKFVAPETFKAAADQFPLDSEGFQVTPMFEQGDLVEDSRTGQLAKVIFYPQEQPVKDMQLVAIQYLDDKGNPVLEKGRMKYKYVPDSVLREAVKLEDF